MDCITPPFLCERDSTFKEHRNKNKNQLVQSRGVIYTYCRQVSEWTVTVTTTVTITITVTIAANLIVTLNKEKGKNFDLNVCLKRILKWTIFSCAGDRLARKCLCM